MFPRPVDAELSALIWACLASAGRARGNVSPASSLWVAGAVSTDCEAESDAEEDGKAGEVVGAGSEGDRGRIAYCITPEIVLPPMRSGSGPLGNLALLRRAVPVALRGLDDAWRDSGAGSIDSPGPWSPCSVDTHPLGRRCGRVGLTLGDGGRGTRRGFVERSMACAVLGKRSSFASSDWFVAAAFRGESGRGG